jgi:DNA replication protein DnaC
MSDTRQYDAASTGTGKSFIACALGNQAARDGHSVRYQRLSRLLDELAMQRAEGRYASVLARLSKVRLLILDDWLMAKLTSDQRRDLMEVVDDRHQRGSTLLVPSVIDSAAILRIDGSAMTEMSRDRETECREEVHRDAQR